MSGNVTQLAGAIPPQNLDAEESVLGAMMLSAHAIDAVADTGLRSSDFYRQSHGVVFDAILRLYARGEAVDGITVVNELDRTGKLEEAQGAERVHELYALVPAASNAAHYAQIVREMATLRALVRAGNDIARLGFERGGTEEELVDRAEQALFSVTQQRFQSEYVPLSTMYREEFERITKLHETGAGLVGAPTGFRSLDRVLGGMQGGQLIVLAARPSMGKSALALCIAAHLVLRASTDVVMHSLEMSRGELMQRIMGMEGMIDSQRLRTGQLDGGDWKRLIALGSKVTTLERSFVVDDNGSATLAEMRSKLRRERSRRPNLGLVIVDYLQLMSQGAKLSERVQEVSQISRGLKVLARELDVPIMAISQLNRGPEQRVSDHRPMLSDLRESGSIEQDADVVMFVYRDDYYHPDSEEKGMAEVIVAKNRNGAIAVGSDAPKLLFQKQWARFREPVYHGEEEPT